MNTIPAIVYAEDDAQSREIMSLLLIDQMGLSDVTFFEDTANFISRLENIQPQPGVILLDIHIRPHTGFEVLEMLRNHPVWQQVPVIALTASVMNEEVYKLREAGFNGVVAKPIDLDTFPDILTRLLREGKVWNTFI